MAATSALLSHEECPDRVPRYEPVRRHSDFRTTGRPGGCCTSTPPNTRRGRAQPNSGEDEPDTAVRPGALCWLRARSTLAAGRARRADLLLRWLRGRRPLLLHL